MHQTPLGIKVDNHAFKNQILGNGYINVGIRKSNKLLLFITTVLKKLGKNQILAQNEGVFAGSFIKPGDSLTVFKKKPGTDGSLNLIFSNTRTQWLFDSEKFPTPA